MVALKHLGMPVTIGDHESPVQWYHRALTARSIEAEVQPILIERERLRGEALQKGKKKGK